VAEVHDCFTIAELLCYEAMGLADRGAGSRVLDDETVYPKAGCRSTSPELESQGAPDRRTGVSMHALCAMQLTGQAGEMQVRSPDWPASSTWRGGRCNYVSIWSRSSRPTPPAFKRCARSAGLPAEARSAKAGHSPASFTIAHRTELTPLSRLIRLTSCSS